MKLLKWTEQVQDHIKWKAIAENAKTLSELKRKRRKIRERRKRRRKEEEKKKKKRREEEEEEEEEYFKIYTYMFNLLDRRSVFPSICLGFLRLFLFFFWMMVCWSIDPTPVLKDQCFSLCLGALL
jgi:hypothetical protein